MSVSELDALIAALPGNVWSADAAADQVLLDTSLLRIAGLGEGATAARKWLSAINSEDLVDGSLAWTPVDADSAVSTTSFGLKGYRGQQIRLRVYVAPLVREGGAKEWVGTFFVEENPPSSQEYVARALLERVAYLGGYVGARPATIAPVPVSQERRIADFPREGRLAVITGCASDDAERLELILEIFEWNAIRANRISPDLAAAAHVIFTVRDSFIPSNIARPFSAGPVVIFLAELPSEPFAAEAARLNVRILRSPVDIAQVEKLIGELAQG